MDERPGVNGVEVTDEGVKGRPFTLRAWKDTANYNAAWSEFNELRGMIRQDPVELIFSDISTFVEGYMVQVLDVRPVLITRIIPGKGGLNPPSAGWLEVDLDLIAIEG